MALICGLWDIKSLTHSPAVLYRIVFLNCCENEKKIHMRFNKTFWIYTQIVSTGDENQAHSMVLVCVTPKILFTWRNGIYKLQNKNPKEKKGNFHFRSVNTHEIFAFVVNYWNSHKVYAWLHNVNGTNHAAVAIINIYSEEAFSETT